MKTIDKTLLYLGIILIDDLQGTDAERLPAEVRMYFVKQYPDKKGYALFLTAFGDVVFRSPDKMQEEEKKYFGI